MSTEPTEHEDELEADDDFDPAPLSFFADAHTDRSKLRPHELADVHDRDDRIATNVYRIYLGKLSARGLSTPKDAGRAYWRAQHADSIARSRRRAALRPERHEPKEEEPIMPKNEEKETKETASSAARDAAVSLAKTSGVAPTIAEVKRALAKSYPDVTDFAIRQALKRAGIAFTSVKGQRPANSATEQKKPTVAKAKPAPRAVSSDELTPAGNHAAIVALETHRAKIAAQLEAIDLVIEGLRR